MSDFGLVLPEHDLTAQEFKELARRIGRAAFVPLFLRYYERVVTSEATVEEQRKGLADIARWTGVEEEKKLDPNANLPVFNIVFGAPAKGSASITAVEVLPDVSASDNSTAQQDVPDIPPEMLQMLPQSMLKEVSDVKEVQRASPSAVLGAVGADAPRKRRRKRDEGERPQAVPDAQPAAPEAPAVQDVQAPQREMTLADHMSDLDKLLGL